MHRAERDDTRREYWPAEVQIRQAIEDAEVCRCPVVRYERNLLCCADCHTVYGVAEHTNFRSGWSKLTWKVDFGLE
jgi:lysyl-tRNA synthetase class I